MTGRHGTDAQPVPFDHDGFVPCVPDGLMVACRVGTLCIPQGKGQISRRIAVACCDCWDRWVSPCACGAKYSSEGDRLLPRRYWGEEASEAFQASQELDRKARSIATKGWRALQDAERH